MKSAIYENFDLNNNLYYNKNCEDIADFFSTINYNIGDKVLLIGDIGNFGKKLRMLGLDVTILDNTQYHDICCSLVFNTNCNAVKGCLEYLPFGENHFDKIIILNHFNHVHDIDKALTELYRVVRINGEVIIEEENMKSLSVKLRALKHRVCGDNIKYYYPNEIMQMFNNINFEGILKEIKNKRYIYIGKKHI